MIWLGIYTHTGHISTGVLPQSDQYKVGGELGATPQYCESVPPVKKCSSSLEIAYTSHQVFKGEKKIQSR